GPSRAVGEAEGNTGGISEDSAADPATCPRPHPGVPDFFRTLLEPEPPEAAVALAPPVGGMTAERVAIRTPTPRRGGSRPRRRAQPKRAPDTPLRRNEPTGRAPSAERPKTREVWDRRSSVDDPAPVVAAGDRPRARKTPTRASRWACTEASLVDVASATPPFGTLVTSPRGDRHRPNTESTISSSTAVSIPNRARIQAAVVDTSDRGDTTDPAATAVARIPAHRRP
ncbi:MAG: hypothetical protein JWN32_2990, partial [Solirubrobacterales bacterium]|nr:hypothetical protein [Solirubrobacterales bacterium]